MKIKQNQKVAWLEQALDDCNKGTKRSSMVYVGKPTHKPVREKSNLKKVAEEIKELRKAIAADLPTSKTIQTLIYPRPKYSSSVTFDITEAAERKAEEEIDLKKFITDNNIKIEKVAKFENVNIEPDIVRKFEESTIEIYDGIIQRWINIDIDPTGLCSPSRVGRFTGYTGEIGRTGIRKHRHEGLNWSFYSSNYDPNRPMTRAEKEEIDSAAWEGLYE